jgi:hypothetical protein
MRLTEIERRVLQYVEQRGGRANRQDAVLDLASPDAKIHRVINSTGGHLAMIFGRWTYRIRRAGLIRECTRDGGWYSHHEITDAGRKAIREFAA